MGRENVSKSNQDSTTTTTRPHVLPSQKLYFQLFFISLKTRVSTKIKLMGDADLTFFWSQTQSQQSQAKVSNVKYLLSIGVFKIKHT